MSNNTAPIYNPGRPWAVWNCDDIYTGPNGTGQYVPNVGDRVDKIDGNIITSYVVVSVAAGTLLTTLTTLSPPSGLGDIPDAEVLFGIVPDNPLGTCLLYVDRSTIPFTATPDNRSFVFGTEVNSAKVFQGSDISNLGRVISATYDSGGNYTGENVSLSLMVDSALNNNIGVRLLNSFNTSATLADGELVTVVYYDINGRSVEKRQLLAVNTQFVRPTNANNKLVTGISLQSPFLSQTNANTVNYPVNLTPNTTNFAGVVNYSDGSSTVMAIDGVKFAISGLDAYLSTGVGQSFPIVLKYTLQTGEAAYGLSNSRLRQFATTYNLITTSANLNYGVRLFAYPVWNGNLTGYSLRWWLYDMNRSQTTDVTSYVTLVNGTNFSGLSYGNRQILRAHINLASISQIYSSFVYEQNVDVLLEAPGTFRQNTATPPNWFVASLSGVAPMYGAGSFATLFTVSTNVSQLNLSGTHATQADWLSALLGTTSPLINTPAEVSYPTPTHFAVNYGSSDTVYPISSWNQVLTLNQAIASNDTVFVKFFVRTVSSDLQVGIAGLPVYAISSNGAYL